jgi:hypothetical protein
VYILGMKRVHQRVRIDLPSPCRQRGGRAGLERNLQFGIAGNRSRGGCQGALCVCAATLLSGIAPALRLRFQTAGVGPERQPLRSVTDGAFIVSLLDCASDSFRQAGSPERLVFDYAIDPG